MQYGDHPDRMLAELSVSAKSESLYVEVLRSEAHALATDGLDAVAVDELVAHGLVTVSAGTMWLVPVNLAFRGWALRQDRALDRARRHMEEVAADHDRDRYVELLRGNAATSRAFLQLQDEANAEVCAFDRGPYVLDLRWA